MKRLPSCAVKTLHRQEWFSHPEVVERAKIAILPSCPKWLSRRRSAFTLGGLVILTEAKYYAPWSAQGLALLAHELKHGEQYLEAGVLRFLGRYFRNWLKFGYTEAHPQEREAMEFEGHVERHLRREFEFNGGKGACYMENGRGSSADDYRLLPVEPFRSGDSSP